MLGPATVGDTPAIVFGVLLAEARGSSNNLLIERPGDSFLQRLDKRRGILLIRFLVPFQRDQRRESTEARKSVAQLRSNYGRENASAILSGLTSAMILRCDDPASVDYARGKIADEFKQFTRHIEKARLGGQHRSRQKTIRRETEQKEKPVFSKADISSWNAGEGVLVRPNSWAYGRVKLID